MKELLKRLYPGKFILFTVLVLILFNFSLSLKGQEKLYEESYIVPPETVQELLQRDRHYDMLNNISPDGRHFFVPVEEEFSSLNKMAQRTLRLAMLEFCPDVNREWRLSTYGIKGIRIFSLFEKKFHNIELPPDILVSDIVWSPDGKKIAFLAHLKEGSQVWTADVVTGKAGPVSQAFVMATLTGRPSYRRASSPPSRMLQWTPDGGLLTLLVPENRGPEPQSPDVPGTPLIRRTRDKATPTRTYPFLLRTPHDKELFRYYTTAQLALLYPGQQPQLVGRPGMFMDLSLSQDGKYILSERLSEPFSYIVSYSDFPRLLEIIDLEGNVLTQVRKVPLQEAMSRGDNDVLRDLPRDVSWRPDEKGLIFLWREEKKDKNEENGEEEEKRKDRLMFLPPPFNMEEAVTLIDSDKSFSDISLTPEGLFAVVRLSGKNDAEKNRQEIIAYDLTQEPPQPFVLVKDIDPEDILKDPGNILTQRTANGILYAVISEEKNSLYLQGPGYREDLKPQPFIDRIQIKRGKTERVFESSSDAYERPLAVLDNNLEQIVVSREAPGVFPDCFLWKNGAIEERLTSNEDPFPEITSCRGEDFTFIRRDDLEIHGRITLPVGYKEGDKVPAVFWTYPREFQSFKDYEKSVIRTKNLNSFQHLSYRNASGIWLTQGYAVVVPDIPIIGKGNQYNNNYIANLVDSMYAAIRKVDQLGYVDIDRLGHGGHSYGAFATANILAHTPFFKAGIAGDGAYNRTLTPMTFQRERRFIWEAQDVYLEMSPFFYADHLETPLLMYHGAEDNNSGTFLIQSERMLQALTGLGKKAVLYIYPFESHGPRCLETYFDLWARWLEWFDRYVKNEGGRSPKGHPLP
ncbi:MAG: S9 family peptidase [Acidobacteriota bacterium]